MQTPGFIIKNDTIWPLQISLSQVSPLYYDVIQPGQSFVRDTGAVWFTIKAAIFLHERDRITDLDAIWPIAVIAGGALLSVVAGGAATFAAGAVTLAETTALTMIHGTIDMAVSSGVSVITAASTLEGAGFSKTAKLVVAGHEVDPAKPLPPEVSAAFQRIFSLDYITLKSLGCYAGPPWPFRRELEPLRITGGPTYRRVPGKDQVELVPGKLHMDTAPPPAAYGHFVLQAGTALAQSDANYHFLLAANRDLVAVKAGKTGSGTVEVHVLTGASGYKTFSLQTKTALTIENPAEWTFAIARNRDVFAIRKRGSSTSMTEVHVLAAEHGYQTFANQVKTALHATDDTWAFALAGNRDVFAIHQRDNRSGTTEVHILDARANYQAFSFQEKTALPPTDGRWAFDVAENRDLFAFKKNGTQSGTCELHVLAAHAKYLGFAIQTKTALHEIDDTWSLRVAENRDVFAIRRSGGGSNMTEVHVMKA